MANLAKMKGPKPLTIVIKLGELPSLALTAYIIFNYCISKGTSSIVEEKTHEPLLSILSLIVETAVKLHKDGHKVIIVSSGAIGVGLRRMDLDKRPKHLPRVQVRLLGSTALKNIINNGCVGFSSHRTV
jgi:glutamate 5-kinase